MKLLELEEYLQGKEFYPLNDKKLKCKRDKIYGEDRYMSMGGMLYKEIYYSDVGIAVCDEYGNIKYIILKKYKVSKILKKSKVNYVKN
jgi:hypothetical protein